MWGASRCPGWSSGLLRGGPRPSRDVQPAVRPRAAGRSAALHPLRVTCGERPPGPCCSPNADHGGAGLRFLDLPYPQADTPRHPATHRVFLACRSASSNGGGLGATDRFAKPPFCPCCPSSPRAISLCTLLDERRNAGAAEVVWCRFWPPGDPLVCVVKKQQKLLPNRLTYL